MNSTEREQLKNRIEDMFEAADKASQAGAVVDWRSTCVTIVRSLVEEISRLQQEVLSEQAGKTTKQQAMRVVLEAEKGDNNG